MNTYYKSQITQECKHCRKRYFYSVVPNDDVIPGLESKKDFFNSKMIELKQQRLDYERHLRVMKALPILTRVLEKLVLDLPPNALVPHAADILCCPAVQDIVHANETNDNLTDADFEPLRALFPELFAQTLRDREARLISIITEQLGEGSFDPAIVLQLATTTFRCLDCRDNYGLLTYPRVLVHRHAYTRCRDESLLGRFKLEHPDEHALEYLGLYSWGKCENIVFRKNDVQTLSDVLTMMGYDPKVATRAEVDAKDPIIGCTACRQERWKRKVDQCVMRWSWAVR